MRATVVSSWAPEQGVASGAWYRRGLPLGRHVVHFVRYDDRVYALKETEAAVANSEFEMIRELRNEHLPAVKPVGVVRTGDRKPAYLITRYLDFSLPYSGERVLGRLLAVEHPLPAGCRFDDGVPGRR